MSLGCRGELLFSLTALFYRMFKCGLCSKAFSNEDVAHQHQRIEHFAYHMSNLKNSVLKKPELSRMFSDVKFAERNIKERTV